MQETVSADAIEVSVMVADKSMLLPVRFLYNSRIGVIQAGELKGQLVMPYWNRRSRKNQLLITEGRSPATALPYYPYRDVYWLFRALVHSREGYGRTRFGEFSRLERALASSRTLHAELLSLESGKELEERESDLSSLVASIMMYLNPRVRVLAKREGLEKITAVSTLKDTKGRRNISPLASRMVAIQNRLIKRETEIASISSVYALRKSIIAHVIEALDFEVNTSADFFSKLLEHWDSVVSSPNRVRALQQRLMSFAKIYGGIDIEPYRATFAHAEAECNALSQALEKGLLDDAHRLARRSNVGFQLRKLRSDLELAMFHLSRRKHFADAPFEPEAVIGAIHETLQKLDALETSLLVDFDRSVVEVYLEQTNSYLEHGETIFAHDALQHALVLL